MNPRSFAVLILIAASGLGVRAVSLDVPSQSTTVAAHAEFHVQGVGGCAAAGCHNANGPSSIAGSEYSTWASLDKHARAYDVLREPRSVEMVRKLGWGTKAHEDARCLACHATTNAHGPTGPEILADGVGCESCHGPSQKWRTTHFQASWKALSADAKFHDGLYPTKDLARRVAKCAECHVGSPTREVNHDLIAAGHPRLTFEYAAYHHLYPRHWTKEGSGAEFEARAWLLGQVAAAKAAVELLGARAERAAAGGKLWPELAEYNCYACHHALQAESWRQQRGYAGRTPGAMPWGDWSLFGPRTLVRLKALGAPADDPFAKLAELMNNTSAKPEQVAAAAKACTQMLDDWLNKLAKAPPLSAETVRSLLRQVVNDALGSDAALRLADWDQAAQHDLAVVALVVALGDLDPAYKAEKYRMPLKELQKPLTFPGDAKAATRLDSPTRFTPAEYRAALEKLKAALGQ